MSLESLQTIVTSQTIEVVEAEDDGFQSFNPMVAIQVVLHPSEVKQLIPGNGTWDHSVELNVTKPFE